MAAWLPVVATLPFVLFLLLSGSWANRRYARFTELPAHYDLLGRATRMASRNMISWLLPVLFSVSLLAIAILTAVLPRDMQSGNPVAGVLVGGVCLLIAQVHVLWLTERWARKQH